MSTRTFPSLDDFRAAAQTLDGVCERTPVLRYRDHEAKGAAPSILLKAEIFQPVGSFKLRGIFHAVQALSTAQRARGLLTVSAGNTAQALAWCGRDFGVTAESVMPETAPSAKIDAVRAMGGTPRLVPGPEMFRFLKEELWQHEDRAFIHPWINSDVHLGHGSLGLELAEQAPDAGHVYIPVGGGGLLIGVAAALRAAGSTARIVAVEPTGCPSLARALDAGHPVDIESSTICDGIAVPYCTEELFPLLEELVDDIVLVDDDATRRAMISLLWDNKMLVEPSGAIGLAAALAVNSSISANSISGDSVCLLSGGSLDRSFFATS